MAKNYPFGMSFAPGEHHRLLVELNHGEAIPLQKTSNSSGLPLCRSLNCCVTLPDGQDAVCIYDRKAPDFHYFDLYAPLPEDIPDNAEFRDRYQKQGYGARLCHYRYTTRFSGAEHEVKDLAQTLADTLIYGQMICEEQEQHFMRASEEHNLNTPRLKQPAWAQFKVEEAKKLSGKYAVTDLQYKAVSDLFETIEAANAAWAATDNNAERLVCCFDRLDRCFDVPRYNVLYKAESWMKQHRRVPNLTPVEKKSVTRKSVAPKKGVKSC